MTDDSPSPEPVPAEEENAENSAESSAVPMTARERQLAAIAPYKFKPGTSPNPKGRPKTKPFSDAFKRILMKPVKGKLYDELKRLDPDNPLGKKFTYCDMLCYFAIRKARAGDMTALGHILNRVEGRIPVAFVDEEGSGLDALVDTFERMAAAAERQAEMQDGGKVIEGQS